MQIEALIQNPTKIIDAMMIVYIPGRVNAF